MAKTAPEHDDQARMAKLEALDDRIRAARDARKPKPRPTGGKFTTAGMAWRMVFELVFAMVIGGAMGWGLDSLFGTLPLFLIVFLLLGFASGIRLVMHSAQELAKINDRESGAQR